MGMNEATLSIPWNAIRGILFKIKAGPKPISLGLLIMIGMHFMRRILLVVLLPNVTIILDWDKVLDKWVTQFEHEYGEKWYPSNSIIRQKKKKGKNKKKKKKRFLCRDCRVKVPNSKLSTGRLLNIITVFTYK